MKKRLELTSAGLHILAMGLMLLDHIWATMAMDQYWLTCVGRIAFPIFAFMVVEGYFHTRNLKKYLLRLLVFALISEIPFDLMMGGTAFGPFHQNVLWTFLLGLLMIMWIERVRKKGKLWATVLVSIGACLVGYLAGLLLMVDYFGAGVLTVLVFYFFRGRKWWCFAGQLVCLGYINWEMLATYYYQTTIFGHPVELYQQTLAVLALIPIWLYHGKQGYHSKWFQYFCYAFYPAHILILSLIMLFAR